MHPGRTTRWLEVAFLVVVAVSFVAVRLPFRSTLLIRDEGEYALAGQQILRGQVPYVDFYNQKPPLIFYFMALVQAVAGPNLPALRVAGFLYGAVLVLLLYLTARRIAGPGTAVGCVLAFSVMNFNQAGVIDSVNTEFFMSLWVVLAVYFRLVAEERGNRWSLLLAGVAAGVAYQTKQFGAFVLLFLLVERLWRWLLEGREHRSGFVTLVADAAVMIAGFALVFSAVLLWFAGHGAAQPYLQCTWLNNWEYVGERWSGVGVLPDLIRCIVVNVARWDTTLWLLGIAGVVALAVRRAPSRGRHLWLLLAALAAASLLAGDDYPHYYAPLFIPLAMGCGILTAWLVGLIGRRAHPIWQRVGALLLLLAAWGWPVGHSLSYAFMSPTEFKDVINVKGYPEFAISPEVGFYLRAHTTPDERVLVVGSEPQIYFYAQRLPASRMVIAYPMNAPYTHSSGLRDEFLRDLRERKPVYVVLVAVQRSQTEFPPAGRVFIGSVVDILRRDYHLEARLPSAGFETSGFGQFISIWRLNAGTRR